MAWKPYFYWATCHLAGCWKGAELTLLVAGRSSIHQEANASRGGRRYTIKRIIPARGTPAQHADQTSHFHNHHRGLRPRGNPESPQKKEAAISGGPLTVDIRTRYSASF